MELQSYLKNIKLPSNREYGFVLSSLVGDGELNLSYFENNIGELYVHVDLHAGLKMLPRFHFEGCSKWEKSNEGYKFISYEEKDFSKKIHKKYEMIPEGLNYIENKKGLILEREVQYFSKPEDLDRIFDPMSAVALFTLELQQREKKNVFVFGKQRIMQFQVEKDNNKITIKNPNGTNSTWADLLSKAELSTSSDGIIESIEIPIPMLMGNVTMSRTSNTELTEQEFKTKLEKFFKDF